MVPGRVEQYHRKQAVRPCILSSRSLMSTSPDHRDLAPQQPAENAAARSSAGSSRGSWLFLGFLVILGLLIVVLIVSPKGNRVNAPHLSRLALQPLASQHHPVAL